MPNFYSSKIIKGFAWTLSNHSISTYIFFYIFTNKGKFIVPVPSHYCLSYEFIQVDNNVEFKLLLSFATIYSSVITTLWIQTVFLSLSIIWNLYLKKLNISEDCRHNSARCGNTAAHSFRNLLSKCRPATTISRPRHISLVCDSISAWSNQGSVMCLLSILNQ